MFLIPAHLFTIGHPKPRKYQVCYQIMACVGPPTCSRKQSHGQHFYTIQQLIFSNSSHSTCHGKTLINGDHVINKTVSYAMLWRRRLIYWLVKVGWTPAPISVVFVNELHQHRPIEECLQRVRSSKNVSSQTLRSKKMLLKLKLTIKQTWYAIYIRNNYNGK